MPDQPHHFRIRPETGNYTVQGQSVGLWKYGTYAPAWFADAKREASLENDQAELREIIFAVCTVESYLFEWVRDDVLNGKFRLLTHYFPVNQRPIGITERWKQVINHLHEDGSIPGKPNFGEHYWEEFIKLVDFRNGLVHGRASRPETAGLSEAELPEPTAEELLEKGHGWAVKVVREVIKKLHEAVGTIPPGWITA
jgi:hypothetical protein